MLLGIDVGYSKKKKTTGIAWTGADGVIHAVKCGSTADERRACLPSGFHASTLAIDGPLVPDSDTPNDNVVRLCEQILARKPFNKRCKAGFSHFGLGLKLRHAARATVEQFKHFVARHDRGVECPFPFAGYRIVEAFPNAFLGVLLPEEFFDVTWPRDKKFDAFYEKSATEERFYRLVTDGCGFSNENFNLMIEDCDHERRAAYICLLTAALVERGTFEAIGCRETGWIVLPPRQFWATWSREASLGVG